MSDQTTEQQQLADLTTRLRRRIATSPRRSHTARRAADLIKLLEDPDCSLDIPQRIAAVKDHLSDYSDSLKYSDPIRHAPDCNNE